MAEKVKVEKILEVKERFKSQYPDVVIGFLSSKEEGKVRLEVRTKDEAILKSLPAEFEGFQVNAMKVNEKKFKRYMEAEEKAETETNKK